MPAPRALQFIRQRVTPETAVGGFQNSPSEARYKGPYLVQLAAFRSEAAALATWRDLEDQAPILLASVALIVERAETAGSGVVFRLRAGYFEDIAKATTFCVLLDMVDQDCVVLHR